MKPFSSAPALHLFVCANRRDAGSPLGEGCGERGEHVYDALKESVARERAFARVWITKTHCLGVCPRRGCTMAIYPEGSIVTEVEVSDVAAFAPRIARGG